MCEWGQRSPGRPTTVNSNQVTWLNKRHSRSARRTWYDITPDFSVFYCIYEVIKKDDDLHESDSRDCPNINNFSTSVLCFCNLQVQDGPQNIERNPLFLSWLLWLFTTKHQRARALFTVYTGGVASHPSPDGGCLGNLQISK